MLSLNSIAVVVSDACSWVCSAISCVATELGSACSIPCSTFVRVTLCCCWLFYASVMVVCAKANSAWMSVICCWPFTAARLAATRWFTAVYRPAAFGSVVV